MIVDSGNDRAKIVWSVREEVLNENIQGEKTEGWT